jgi:hypothetical protein
MSPFATATTTDARGPASGAHGVLWRTPFGHTVFDHDAGERRVADVGTCEVGVGEVCTGEI